MQHGFVDW